MSSLLEPLAKGFMLGLTAGPLCLTSCIPVLLPITLAERPSNNVSHTWLFVGKFLGGRFVAYAAFGLLVGVLGSRLGEFTNQVGVYASIVLSLVLMAYGLGVRLPHGGFCRLAGRSAGSALFPFILGGLSGFNICPPFLLAITFTLQRAITPASGLLFFLAFFMATSLYILPVGLAGYISHRELLIRLGRMAAVIVGIVFLYQGASKLWMGA